MKRNTKMFYFIQSTHFYNVQTEWESFIIKNIR